MTQTRLGSLIEATVNTFIGFVITIGLSLVVYPAFGHRFTLAQNAGITLIFTVASVARGYVLRRWFNARLYDAAVRAAAAFQRRTP